MTLLHCKSACFTSQNLCFRRAKQPFWERKTIGFEMCFYLIRLSIKS